MKDLTKRHFSPKSVASSCIGISIASIVVQACCFEFIWPDGSNRAGPGGGAADGIALIISLFLLAVVSLFAFIPMLVLGVKWYVGQFLAILNFLIAASLSLIIDINK